MDFSQAIADLAQLGPVLYGNSPEATNRVLQGRSQQTADYDQAEEAQLRAALEERRKTRSTEMQTGRTAEEAERIRAYQIFLQQQEFQEKNASLELQRRNEEMKALQERATGKRSANPAQDKNEQAAVADTTALLRHWWGAYTKDPKKNALLETTIRGAKPGTLDPAVSKAANNPAARQEAEQFIQHIVTTDPDNPAETPAARYQANIIALDRYYQEHWGLTREREDSTGTARINPYLQQRATDTEKARDAAYDRLIKSGQIDQTKVNQILGPFAPGAKPGSRTDAENKLRQKYIQEDMPQESEYAGTFTGSDGKTQRVISSGARPEIKKAAMQYLGEGRTSPKSRYPDFASEYKAKVEKGLPQ